MENILKKHGDRAAQDPVVNSYNEWNQLEEVIVGRIEGAVIPSLDEPAIKAVIKPKTPGAKKFFSASEKPYPNKIIKNAKKELDEFISILRAENIIVRRPEKFDFSKKYITPYWESRGFSMSCPRDAFLVIGNEIIEAPISWRSRYFESIPYKNLFSYYFEHGEKWIFSPKPLLKNDLYGTELYIENDISKRCVTDESEIVFDAADFLRFGKDIVVARSHTTNYKGIEWLRRHLGDTYRVHCIDNVKAKCPMHLDTTFVPLAPGKLIVNPKYYYTFNLPEIFKSWDIFIAPEPEFIEGVSTTFFGSIWLSLNMISIAPNRVIVEARQKN